MVQRIKIRRSQPFHYDLKKSIYSFLSKNLFCKNIEAEIKLNFKNVLKILSKTKSQLRVIFFISFFKHGSYK